MEIRRILGPLLIALMFSTPALAAETSTAAGSAEVAKLGKISPNGPYRLWTAINGVLPAYAALKGGAGLRAQVEYLAAFDASGKKPGDVMVQTNEFRRLLEILRDQLKLAEIEIYKDPLGRAVTPAVVFVNAGFNMDALVEAYFTALNKPDAMVGEFYEVPVSSGKTPSDVYALAELATRRLRLIQGS